MEKGDSMLPEAMHDDEPVFLVIKKSVVPLKNMQMKFTASTTFEEVKETLVAENGFSVDPEDVILKRGNTIVKSADEMRAHYGMQGGQREVAVVLSLRK